MDDKKLKAELERMLASDVPGASSPTTRSEKGMGLLGLAVLRLNESTTRLAWFNISLGAAVLIAALVQIVLMFRYR
jgi:hypothetical protein